MPIANGKEFQFESIDQIKPDFLETFPYEGHPQLITIETSEFSAVCPFSGLPDIASIIIHYIPTARCVELKSFKYYLLSFRQVGIYQEAVTNRIFDDLLLLLEPQYIKLTTIYNTRGGINTTCTCEQGINSISLPQG